jgi:RNase adaptor protein for sRNA GlmZ degradation
MNEQELQSGMEEFASATRDEALRKAKAFREKMPKELEEDFMDLVIAFYSYGFDYGAHTGVLEMKKDILGGEDGNELLSSKKSQ